MDTADILRTRLAAQLIEGAGATTAHDVVSRLLAMQAQDYAAATWAIGLRLPGSTLPDVERAIADREIVRTWPMRGTLHFVAAEDARWMTALLSPRILARAAKRERDLGLDAATFGRARELFASALTGGRRLARPDAMVLLESGGIATTGQRGYHILWRLAQEGLLVVGPMEGRQQTFALLDEWVPASRSALDPDAPREELLATLAARYFAGHGPATVADLARWAGITKSEAGIAAAAADPTLASAEHDGERYRFDPAAAERASHLGRGSVHLLPGFDEYMLGYTDRRLQLGEHLDTYGSHVASNGMLAATVVVDGRAVGVWKRSLTARTVRIAVMPFRPLTATERAGIAEAQARYAAFVGRELAG
jgi:hypothetical protein